MGDYRLFTADVLRRRDGADEFRAENARRVEIVLFIHLPLAMSSAIRAEVPTPQGERSTAPSPTTQTLLLS